MRIILPVYIWWLDLQPSTRLYLVAIFSGAVLGRELATYLGWR
jgi:hypothetical protein